MTEQTSVDRYCRIRPPVAAEHWLRATVRPGTAYRTTKLTMRPGTAIPFPTVLSCNIQFNNTDYDNIANYIEEINPRFVTLIETTEEAYVELQQSLPD